MRYNNLPGLLIKKHNFDNPEVFKAFCKKYSYNESVIQGILDSKWDNILKCHADDFAEFTGECRSTIYEFYKDLPKAGFATAPPIGRPYYTEPHYATLSIDGMDKEKFYPHAKALLEGKTMKPEPIEIRNIFVTDMIEEILENHELFKQGIVGIELPDMGTTDTYETLGQILGTREINGIGVCVIPEPVFEFLNSPVEDRSQDLLRRIKRDRIDGIRYNRIYIALYERNFPEELKKAHDVFVTITDKGPRYKGIIEQNQID